MSDEQPPPPPPPQQQQLLPQQQSPYASFPTAVSVPQQPQYRYRGGHGRVQPPPISVPYRGQQLPPQQQQVLSPTNPNICRNWLRTGECPMGEACLYLHPTSLFAQQQAPQPPLLPQQQQQHQLPVPIAVHQQPAAGWPYAQPMPIYDPMVAAAMMAQQQQQGGPQSPTGMTPPVSPTADQGQGQQQQPRPPWPQYFAIAPPGFPIGMYQPQYMPMRPPLSPQVPREPPSPSQQQQPLTPQSPQTPQGDGLKSPEPQSPAAGMPQPQQQQQPPQMLPAFIGSPFLPMMGTPEQYAAVQQQMAMAAMMRQIQMQAQAQAQGLGGVSVVPAPVTSSPQRGQRFHGGHPPSRERDNVCNTWRRTGTCPNDQCQYDHPPQFAAPSVPRQQPPALQVQQPAAPQPEQPAQPAPVSPPKQHVGGILRARRTPASPSPPVSPGTSGSPSPPIAAAAEQHPKPTEASALAQATVPPEAVHAQIDQIQQQIAAVTISPPREVAPAPAPAPAPQLTPAPVAPVMSVRQPSPGRQPTAPIQGQREQRSPRRGRGPRGYGSPSHPQQQLQ